MPEAIDQPRSTCYLCDKPLDTEFLCSECEIGVEQAIAAEHQGNPQPVADILDKMDARLRKEQQQLREEAKAIGLDLGPIAM